MKVVKQAVRGLFHRAGYDIISTRVATEQPQSNLGDRKPVFPNIPGYFTEKEADLLYLLSFMSRGRILEVGHFLGRSTSVICEGIRDSGRSVEFNSYDIGFSTPEEIREFYKKVYDDPEWENP